MEIGILPAQQSSTPKKSPTQSIGDFSMPTPTKPATIGSGKFSIVAAPALLTSSAPIPPKTPQGSAQKVEPNAVWDPVKKVAKNIYNSQAVQGGLEVLNVPATIAEAAAKKALAAIPDNILSDTSGIKKYGPVIAGFAGGLADPFADLGPAAGLASKLLKEKTIPGAFTALREAGVAEDAAKTFAPHFAKAKSPQEVMAGLNALEAAAKDIGSLEPLAIEARKHANPSEFAAAVTKAHNEEGKFSTELGTLAKGTPGESNKTLTVDHLTDFYHQAHGETTALDTASAAAREVDPLVQEARKYASPGEFINSQKPIYRGGPAIDPSLINEDGVSFSKSKEIADNFAQEKKGNVLEKAYIDPTAKVIKIQDVPKEFRNDFDAAAYAKRKGFDVLDFNGSGFMDEVRVLNPEVLKTETQLNDVYKLATEVSDHPPKASQFNIDLVEDPKVRGDLRLLAEEARNTETVDDFIAKNVKNKDSPIQSKENLLEFYHDANRAADSFASGVANNTYPRVEIDTMSQQRAFAETIEGDLKKKGFGGFGQDLKNHFEDWVNQRRAAKIEAFFKAREFKALDAKDIGGIFEFQEGNLTSELKKLQKYFDDKYATLRDAGVNVGYKENYLPQLWHNTDEELLGFERKLGLKPSFTMESIIENYKKGIEYGLTPRYTKLSELAQWYEARANKAMADRKFFDFLASKNFIQPATNSPLGWKTLDPDHFPMHTIHAGEKIYTGVLKSPPDLANVINNYLKTPEGPIASFANFASTVKNIVLSSGIPKTGINAHGINILTRNMLSANNPIGGFLTGSYYLVNPSAAERYLLKNSAQATFFVRHGLTLSTEEHALGVIEGNLAQKGLDKLLSVQSKYFEVPLFNKIIPAIKTERAGVIFDDLSKHYPVEVAAKMAAHITNNIFGGINWESFGRSRETQNIMRSVLLAPDWAETQIKLGKNITQSLLLKPRSPELKAYRIMARNLILAYTAANAANKASSGHWMWENDPGHTFEIQVGKTENGQHRYIRPFGTAADFARIPYDVALALAKGDLSSVGRVVRNRISAPFGAAASVIFNTDFAGRPILGKDKYGNEIPVKQQVGGIIGVASGLGMPQYGQALIDLATGRNNLEQTVSRGLELPFNYYKPYVKKSSKKSGGASKGIGNI